MTLTGERFVIVQLYPDELGVTGDRGNVLALSTRLTLAGAEVTVVSHRRGDTLASDPDLVVIGNGPLSAVRTILDDLRSNAETIAGWVRSGVPVLAVGAGMEVLGTDIVLPDGETIAGVGAFPLSTTRGAARRMGYVVVDTSIGTMTGFEDHSCTTTLVDSQPFGTVSRGIPSLMGGNDGIILGNSVGTRIQGPVLPLNPALTDHLIRLAAERRDLAWAPLPAHAELDRLASESRAVMQQQVEHDFGGA